MRARRTISVTMKKPRRITRQTAHETACEEGEEVTVPEETDPTDDETAVEGGQPTETETEKEDPPSSKMSKKQLVAIGTAVWLVLFIVWFILFVDVAIWISGRG